MSKGYSDFEADRVNNYPIVDAIDRLYAAQAEKTAREWLNNLEDRSLEPAATLSKFIWRLGRKWWSDFTVNPIEPSRISWTKSDDELVMYQRDLEAGFFPDQVENFYTERRECFRTAIKPLVLDLQSGRTRCDGVENSADWKRTETSRPTPNWFHRGIWKVVREGNILEIDLDGKIWKFVNVRLSRDKNPDQTDLGRINLGIRTILLKDQDSILPQQVGVSEHGFPTAIKSKEKTHSDKARLKRDLRVWLTNELSKPETLNWPKEAVRIEAKKVFQHLTGKLFSDVWKVVAPGDRKRPGRRLKQSSENLNP